MPKKRGVSTVEGADTLAARLTRLRLESGLTQQDLADQLGITQPNISDYERGILRLHGELILRLAEIFGVSTDEILGLKPRKASSGEPANIRLLKRLKKIEALPPAKQRVVLRSLDTLIKGIAS